MFSVLPGITRPTRLPHLATGFVALTLLAACGAAETTTPEERPSTTGSIDLSVTGLAAGTPRIVVTGPNTYRRELTAAALLDGLAVGVYHVKADPVIGGGRLYVPALPEQDIAVQASRTAGRVTVGYATAAKGALQLAVSGLPTGVQAYWTLRTPGGIYVEDGEVVQGGSVVLTDIAPGTYSITWKDEVADVDGEPQTFKPTAPSAQITIGSAGSVAATSVQYRQTTGTLEFAATGLPAGESARWTLRTGAGSYVDDGQVAQGGKARVSNISAGTYLVKWEEVEADTAGGPHTFKPSTASQSVTVVAVPTAAPAAVAYKLATGAFALAPTGLPAGITADWSLHDSRGWTVLSGRVVSGTTVPTTNVAPGSYTLRWSNETFAVVTTGAGNGDKHTYAPGTASQTLTISASATPVAAPVTYALATGSLDITVQGLPAGETASYYLVDSQGTSGHNGSCSQGSTCRVSDVLAGTYTLRWYSEYVNGTTRRAPDAQVIVTRSLTPKAITATYR